jgi:hypothetical protein
MIAPEIEVKQVGDDIICKISYDNVIVEAGYKPDGSLFIMSDSPMMDIANEFTRISGKMWSAVCDKFDMNPGNALEARLIDIKYCKQMQFAGIIGYDLCGAVLYNDKGHRDMKEFFEENLK